MLLVAIAYDEKDPLTENDAGLYAVLEHKITELLKDKVQLTKWIAHESKSNPVVIGKALFAPDTPEMKYSLSSWFYGKGGGYN